jgi:hypothetical protein
MQLCFGEIVIREMRMSSTSQCLIILMWGLSISILYLLGSIPQTFSEKSGSIDISLINSSFVPLSNTEANQVKVNFGYTLENEKMQNQLVNAVMELYAPNGTLIRTTSIASGFTLQTDGEQLLKTSLNDKSLQRVSIKIILTDLSKKIPLSNSITKDLKLEEALTTKRL